MAKNLLPKGKKLTKVYSFSMFNALLKCCRFTTLHKKKYVAEMKKEEKNLEKDTYYMYIPAVT